MIEKALKYLFRQAEPYIREIDGHTYSNKELERISYNPKAAEIELNTLSSLTGYIKSGIDKMQGKMIIHVQSPTKVCLYSCLDDERKREHIATVKARVPAFNFGQFMGHEAFALICSLNLLIRLRTLQTKSFF